MATARKRPPKTAKRTDAPKRKPGRPATPPEVIDAKMRAVCERIAKGELVKYAAQAEGTDHNRVREWGLTPEYSGMYARARELQAHALAEQAIEIADGQDGLTVLYEEAIEAEEDRVEGMADGKAKSNAYAALASLRSNVVTRDRMRLDARKWLTSKIAPKLYGDTLDVTSKGERIMGVIALPPEVEP